MILRPTISAGEFFDFIRPVVLVVSAFVSTCVLRSARRRFGFWSSLTWALGTLFLPLIVLPLYLASIWLRRPNSVSKSEPPLTNTLGIPLLYGSIVLLAIGAYLYHDYTTVDAYLARAAQARIKGKRAMAIAEYRAALSKEDSAHTHKLLAIELEDAGDRTNALQEFRRAEAEGELDDSIAYHIADLLYSLNHPAEAKLEYERYLNSKACTQEFPDTQCEGARKKLQK